jgi:hypothetical protein
LKRVDGINPADAKLVPGATSRKTLLGTAQMNNAERLVRRAYRRPQEDAAMTVRPLVRPYNRATTMAVVARTTFVPQQSRPSL